MAVEPAAMGTVSAAQRALRGRLGVMRRRVRLLLALRLATPAVALVAAAGALTITISKLQGITYPLSVPAMAMAAAIVAAIIAALVWPLPDEIVARAADRRLGSRDRLATAIELVGAPDRSGMDRAQIANAVGYAATARPRDAFALTLTRTHKVALGCVVALLAAHLLPIPALLLSQREREDRAELRQIAQTMQPVVQRLEREAQATGDEQTREVARRMRRLTAQMRRGTLDRKRALLELAEVDRKLDELQREIKPPSLRTASAALDEMRRQGSSRLAARANELADRAARKGDQQREAELRKLAQRAEQAQNTEQMRQIASELSAQAGALGTELPVSDAAALLSTAIAAQDWQATLEELGRLQDILSGSDRHISPREAKELAEQLERLADQLKGTDLEKMGECLRQAGQCLRQGDCKGAARCLGAACQGEGREGMAAVRLREAARCA
ncbi:MAG TPA: hypothetical protein VM283_00560, partial [Armatimonadota bacterium]|nr:hypothetical protein [Armatimonadota bacterium]